MNCAIVYSSRTGNTKMLADKVRETIKENCIYFGEMSDEALKADKIYVGFWTDRGSCDNKTAEFLKKAENKEIFLFGTAGFGERQEYLDGILKTVKKEISDSNSILGEFMCQGKMPQAVRERYVKQKEAPDHNPNIDMLIANFDKALSHPDEEDLKNLEKVLK